MTQPSAQAIAAASLAIWSARDEHGVHLFNGQRLPNEAIEQGLRAAYAIDGVGSVSTQMMGGVDK